MTGETDRALRKEIEDAVGVVGRRPESRATVRRRAREAAADAAALLRSEGYYEGTAEAIVSESEPPTANVRVVSGARFRFGAARVDWVGPAPTSAAAKAGAEAIGLKMGAPGRAADVLAAEGRIVAVLQQNGYADAEIRPRRVVVDFADRSVEPTFEIAAGAVVRLGEIELVRKGKTHPAWVRGLVPWKSGAVYKPDLVARLERILRDTGVYDSVTVGLAPLDRTAAGLRPVLVNLSDRPGRTLELGAGYSTGEGSGVTGTLSWYNRLGRADTLILTAIAYDIEQKLDLELDLPDWRRPDQTLKVGGGLLGDRTDAYDDIGGGVRLNVERHWTKTTFLTLGAALDYVSTQEKTEINPDLAPVGVSLNLFIASTLGAIALDRSNDPLNPTRGWRLQAQIEPTAITGDHQLVYLKASTQASAYLPLTSDASTVLAGRVRLGSILGGSIPDVPADRRFYAGGGGSVRGYGYQDVGPRLSDNTPEGGLSLVETSLEVRQRITGRGGRSWPSSTRARWDWETAELQFHDISTGVGVGGALRPGLRPAAPRCSRRRSTRA